MSKVTFIRKGGRVIPILKKMGQSVKDIPHAFKKIPKDTSKKAGKLMAKIDGGIEGKKKFMKDTPSLSQKRVGQLRKDISRQRDRYFKVKHSSEDRSDMIRKMSSKKKSGIRGLKIAGGITLSGTGLAGLNRQKNKNKSGV